MRSLLLSLVLLMPFGSLVTADEHETFEAQIVPLLAQRCMECHNGQDRQGGLDLSNEAGLHHGGDSGPVTAESVTSSLLWQRVSTGEMPPESQGEFQRLAESELATLRRWLESGAPWPPGRTIGLYEKTTVARGGLDWWSLRPIQRPVPPPVTNMSWCNNPVDQFILATLETNQMQPAPPANRQTLIRRLFFDLTGLPPSPEQVQAFFDDRSPQAYERLVDVLLASPQYGQRWARHWLDVVRFAETCGYERDQLKPQLWRYRDWVVDALNCDLPYDQFVLEQLAGDELPERSEDTLIATGMLRAGTFNDEPNDPADYLYTRLEDLVHTTTSAFLGLTVKCARCHNHKFDPVYQTDYYRVASYFWPGYTGQANLGGPTAEELGFDVCGWTDRERNPSPIHLLVKGERTQPGPAVPPGFLSCIPELDQPLESPLPGGRTTERRRQFAQWIADPQNPLTSRVMVNRLWLHHFGEGIVRSPNNFGFKGEVPTHPELLDWLAAEFMQGGWRMKRMHKLIVMSSTYQQASSHPRHKDYAERDFLNRYVWRANRRRLDAESLRDALLNTSGQLNLAMRGPSFYPHLSEEALEGLSQKSGAWQESPPPERAKRSIYMMTKRSRLLPLMTAFDFSDTTLPCGQRDVTTVAPQALALLNNEQLHEISSAFAQRIVASCADRSTEYIERAWWLALGRAPTEFERDGAQAFLERQTRHFRTAGSTPNDSRHEASDRDAEQLALESLCHVLLNTNEFIYID
ncbi:MAG: PSD1 domain-containing protein [Planctomycetales bacterium]|nr:PSD1 domain-containing protein [Planctomycetales bacterium]